jgi:hypothetical protein
MKDVKKFLLIGCGGMLVVGFKTGQFNIAANEAKRIEVNFTKP